MYSITETVLYMFYQDISNKSVYSLHLEYTYVVKLMSVSCKILIYPL